MNKICAFILIPSFCLGIQAAACTLDKPGEPLKIACTFPGKCGESFRETLRTVGQSLGYQNVTVVDVQGTSELNNFDGILSPGGHDIDPKYFSARLAPQAKKELRDLHTELGNEGKADPAYDRRDAQEAAIMRAYFNDDKFRSTPLLGVCYGMQMMAAVNNVPLYIDIERQLGIPARRRIHDSIQFTGSDKGRLRDLPASFPGYKNHHQAVDSRNIEAYSNGNLKVRATSNGGKIPEVIEAVNRPAVGVQFHSEAQGQNDKNVAKSVFGWFLRQACANRNAKAKAAARVLPSADSPNTVPESKTGSSGFLGN